MGKGERGETLGRRGVGKMGADLIFVTEAVFHRETSPLNLSVLSNMYLGVATDRRQGRAGRSIDATQPRAAGREAAVQVSSKMRETEQVIAQLSSTLSSKR